MLKFIKSFFAKPVPPTATESEMKLSSVLQAPLPEKVATVPSVPRTPIANNIDEVGKVLAEKAKAPRVKEEVTALKEEWPFPIASQPTEPAVVAPIKKRKPRAKKAT